MQDLYEKTTRDNYEDMRRYIESVAVYGTGSVISASLHSASSIGFPFEELTSLMFYIAIQEDINYPDAHYQGRKMCFYRYLEAVYCKVHGNHELHEAIEKAVARYIPKNWRDVGDLYEVVSGICR